jgi:hypothetical protein
MHAISAFRARFFTPRSRFPGEPESHDTAHELADRLLAGTPAADYRTV